MKSLLLTLLITTLSSAAYANGAKLWKDIGIAKKEKLLDAYVEFYEEYSAQNIEVLAELKPVFLIELLSSAYANSEMNCIYAGWPSKRVSGLCSTPIRYNPGYEAGGCKSSELQCQPMLFGTGFCVPTNTQSQRSLAFSNCAQKFATSGRTPRDVINEIEKAGKQTELFEVMGFADKTCTSGKQATTGMCNRLRQVLDKIKAEEVKSIPPKTEIDTTTPPKQEDKQLPPALQKFPKLPIPPKSPQLPPFKVPEVFIDGKKETNPEIADDFISSVEQADKINATTSSAGIIMCDTSEPLSRTTPRSQALVIGSKYVDGNYEYLYYKDKAGQSFDNGVSVTMRGPNHLAPMVGGQPTNRVWQFLSEDNSINGSFINITDEPTPGTLSHLMETNIVLIPRKEKPRAITKGNEIHVTLPTGEMVIFDAKTKMIKKGAFKEEAIDINPNRLLRKFKTTYSGNGISIRTDRRGGDPRTGAGVVSITQKGKTCSIPKDQVWGGSADHPKFKFSDDAKLVNFLNTKCSAKFNL